MMKKMYIAVLDEVPDLMIPTLVAHTVIIYFRKMVNEEYW